MDKYMLIILLIGEQPEITDIALDTYLVITKLYAFSNTTFVLIFVGDTVHRIIAGKQISDIGELSELRKEIDEASVFVNEEKTDKAARVQKWITEAQANIYIDTDEVKTAIFFVDISEEVSNKISSCPSHMTGGAESIDFYTKIKCENGYDYKKTTLSNIEHLTLLAKDGDEKSLFELGIAYLYGQGVDKDLIKAKFLFYESYLRGNMDALKEYKKME